MCVDDGEHTSYEYPQHPPGKFAVTGDEGSECLDTVVGYGAVCRNSKPEPHGGLRYGKEHETGEYQNENDGVKGNFLLNLMLNGRFVSSEPENHCLKM